ncbi:hypothetical protein [Anabaena subtropica]|uniref:Uncharacterized protein n=1 Tax=Anabaena subtropica FACHB-260 TaxID=2692884 RepID=A0ABR8CQK9_9NOST|nr:hypothetical protein [Anabaena subtropica]MBD2344684.1 hypothetical protein [Anabaena subtropica FACHB-260]
MKTIKLNICKLEANQEWLCLDSMAYITECLEACVCADMLADLREIFPRQALTVASVKVCELQRKRIQKWLKEMNGEVQNLDEPPQVLQNATDPCLDKCSS